MKFHIGILAALWAGAAAPSFAAQERPVTSSVCTSEARNYEIARGEPGFQEAAKGLNDFVAGPSTHYDKVLLPQTARRFVSDSTEVIRIGVDVMSCADGSNGANVGTLSIGGCDYVGCVGNVPGEFANYPNGSRVTLEACGGGTRTSGTFVRGSNGLWVMTSYETERVTNCSAIG